LRRYCRSFKTFQAVFVVEKVFDNCTRARVAQEDRLLTTSDADEALVNKVVFALMSGLPFKTSFKNGVELVKGFLDAAIDLVPAAVFQ